MWLLSRGKSRENARSSRDSTAESALKGSAPHDPRIVRGTRMTRNPLKIEVERSGVVSKGVVVKADFLRCLAEESGEQVRDEAAELVSADRVKIVFPVPAGFDEAGDSQQGEVVADGGLTLAQPIAQGAHVKFPLAVEVHQNAQTGFIRKELEDLDEIFLQFRGKLGEEVVMTGFFRRFQQLRRHSISLWVRREFPGRSILPRNGLPRLI